ncbi:hypothetical protein NS263_00695 [Curtobacterium oceanosedimentum]|uniref:DUF4190 domain-containing protein n=1 Tax=Curtobacterium oceanosedimentum TaxID=465820 RepID=A0A147DRE1_9MICO|nr:hypothetical protein [Curtobacterium oceanosedimentum]KTR43067.1 hypothetical protein NS263_00695 [Curtobacterium oceanosedimentum]KTR52270.1 hypothetical protein NS359_06945 [Curtobacterium oceanosedimentum]
MAAGARDHEPPAVLATVAVLLAPLSLWMGIIVPAADMARHVTLELVFGVVCVLCGLRAAHLAGRRRAVRTWAWIGLVLGALGLVMMGWQLLTFATDGAFPPPFWSPYARR